MSEARNAITVAVELRFWDLDEPVDEEQVAVELRRIAGMIADGYASGEIVIEGPERSGRGWWNFNEVESKS